MVTGIKEKTDLWDRGMRFDIRVQNVLEKKTPVWQTVMWSLGLKKPGVTDRGVPTGVTKFRMASGELIFWIELIFWTDLIFITKAQSSSSSPWLLGRTRLSPTLYPPPPLNPQNQKVVNYFRTVESYKRTIKTNSRYIEQITKRTYT